MSIMKQYQRLRELREKKRKTQAEIGAMLGMKQPQYFRYEKGYRDIPTDVLIALADYYEVSVDYIHERTDKPKGGRG